MSYVRSFKRAISSLDLKSSENDVRVVNLFHGTTIMIFYVKTANLMQDLQFNRKKMPTVNQLMVQRRN